MSTRALALLVIAAALLAPACAEWEGKGLVLDRGHKAAWTEDERYCAFYRNDKNHFMECEFYSTREVQHPAEWWLTLKDPKTGDHRDVHVSQDMWQRCKPGRTYDTKALVCGEDV